MNPRSTLPWAISAIAFDMRVAHRAPATFGGSPMVPRNAGAGWSRMRPTSKSPRAVGACELRATAYARIGSRMPTKTRSPSRISREATATINSCGVYRSPIADAQRLDVDSREIGGPVGWFQHPLPQPGLEAVAGARRSRVVAKEAVVALEIALDRGRMRAAGLVHNRDDLGFGKQDSVWMPSQGRRIEQLLTADDHSAGRQARLLGDAQRPPRVRMAVGVASLHVDDRDIGTHGVHANDVFFANEIRIGTEDVASQKCSGWDIRRVPRGSPQGEGDGEVGVVVDGDRARDALLGGAAVAVAQPAGDVPNPRRRHLAHAPGADELVEKRVRDRPHQL